MIELEVGVGGRVVVSVLHDDFNDERVGGFHDPAFGSDWFSSVY